MFTKLKIKCQNIETTRKVLQYDEKKYKCQRTLLKITKNMLIIGWNPVCSNQCVVNQVIVLFIFLALET